VKSKQTKKAKQSSKKEQNEWKQTYGGTDWRYAYRFGVQEDNN
jgi:hypothetical protein